MGCDIHTRAEVKHDNNGWVMVGEVFDYPYDWFSYPASEALFATLDDGQFMFGILSYFTKVIQTKQDLPGTFLSSNYETVNDPEKLEPLSAEAKKAVLTARKLKEACNEQIKLMRDEEQEKGWDYDGRVRPQTMGILKYFRKRIRLNREVRQELEKLILDFRHEWSDADEVDYSEEELKFTVRLERAEGDPPFKTVEPYGNRNYLLFAALADVRNGYGFAGIDTGDAIEYMDEPRGIPDDCSPEWQEYTDMWGLDGHSASYFTVREIEEWEGWEQTATIRGVVTAEEYERCKRENDTPDSYSGEIWGDKIVTVPWWDYDKWMQQRNRAQEFENTVSTALFGGEKPLWADNDDLDVHVKMQWQVKLRDRVGSDWWEAVERMKELGDPDKVRLMMVFDN